jgi:hypothetical protein
MVVPEAHLFANALNLRHDCAAFYLQLYLATGEGARPLAALAMRPELAKQLRDLLDQQVRSYETAHGEIQPLGHREGVQH